jgi:hypothetical protein
MNESVYFKKSSVMPAAICFVIPLKKDAFCSLVYVYSVMLLLLFVLLIVNPVLRTPLFNKW